MRIIVVLLSLALSSFFLLDAQENQWENITSHQNVVKRIDAGDFSYVATSGGLIVRDWTTNEDVFYNRGNSPLPSINVNDIALDAQGTLWISTYAGTVRYANGEFLENATSSLGTWTAPISDGQAMILAGVSALYIFDWEGNVIEYPLPFFSADPPIPVSDPSTETLYVGLINYFAPSGIVRFKDGEWLEDGESMIAQSYYYSMGLVLTAEGELWHAGESLVRIEGDQIVEEIAFSELEQEQFGQVWLKEDDSANLWLYFLDNNSPALFLKQGNDWILTDRNTLTVDQEACLFGIPAIDNVNESPLENNRVFGIEQYGELTYINASSNVYKRQETNWEDLSEYPGFPDGATNMAITTNGDVWISWGASIYRFSSSESAWKIQLIEEDISTAFNLLEADNSGGLWAVSGGSLLYWQENNWDIYDVQDHGFNSQYFRDVLPNGNSVWFCGQKGLLHFDGNNWTVINEIGLENTWVYDLAVDAMGRLYFKTVDQLGLYSNGTFTYEALPTEIVTGMSGELLVENDGAIWISSYDYLARIKDGVTTGWSLEGTALASGYYESLSFDYEGNLWIGSAQGAISIFNENGIPSPVTNGIVNTLSAASTNWLFPNPVLSASTVRVVDNKLQGLPIKYSIYDLRGIPVLSGNLSYCSGTRFDFSVHGLISGNYIIRYSDGLVRDSIHFQIL